MTNEQLATIRELAKWAQVVAPGQWEAYFTEEIWVYCGGEETNIVCEVGDEGEEGTAELARYIAAIDPTTVLSMVAEIERLREAIARMQANASIPHRVKEIAREALGEKA